jgi:hypothetical protein
MDAKLFKHAAAGVAVDQGTVRLTDKGRVDDEGAEGFLAKIALKIRPGGIGMLLKIFRYFFGPPI